MSSVDILQQCNGACRALLVKEPWASQLVTGKKKMELRSTRCSIRENVAIARIGTSQIIGTCRVVDCTLVATRDLRTGNLVKAPGCPPDFEVKFQLKWHEMKDMMRNYNMIWAWIMEDPVRFECPLQFKRPKGAQIWFRLDKNGNETTSRSNSKNQKKPKRSQSPHVKTQKKRRLKSGWGKGTPPSLLLMLIIGTLGEHFQFWLKPEANWCDSIGVMVVLRRSTTMTFPVPLHQCQDMPGERGMLHGV